MYVQVGTGAVLLAVDAACQEMAPLNYRHDSFINLCPFLHVLRFYVYKPKRHLFTSARQQSPDILGNLSCVTRQSVPFRVL